MTETAFGAPVVERDATCGLDAAAAAQAPPAQAATPATPAAAAAAPAEEHPFETEPGDHAETPFEAYQHLELLLARLAKRLGTSKAALRIYDPFYCEGRMIQHLARLGFESVYNRNEDFYAVRAAGCVPEYDVLVTNPPFSGDHLERIFTFAVRSNKPWCLLIPQYCARKAFYLEWLNNRRPRGTPRPAFLAPTHTPYVFTAPDRADVREMRVKEVTVEANETGSQPAATTAVAEAAEAAAEAKAEGEEAAGAAAGAESDAAAVASTEAALSALCLASPASPAPPAPAAAAAAADNAGFDSTPDPKAFEVAAGSFQCIWFFNLGEGHQKPVFEWLQQQLQLQLQQHQLQHQQQLQQHQLQHQQQQQQQQDVAKVHGPGYTVVSSVRDVPQLMVVQKITPAERRWRKKQAALAAAGITPGGQQQQQQQQQLAGERGARPSPAGASRQPAGSAGNGRQPQQQQRQQQQQQQGTGVARTGNRQSQQQQQQQEESGTRRQQPPRGRTKPSQPPQRPVSFSLLAEIDSDG